MAVWPKRKLGELIELYDHRRVPLNSRERATRQGPYPYYGASGIVDHIDEHLFEGRHILIAEDGENLRSRKTPIAFFADGRFWVNNHAHVALGKPGIADDYFVKVLLEYTDLSPFITGAAQPKLSQANLRLVEIPCPPLATQRAFTRVLSAYDDLIENNTKRIKILEEMARSLYREWFVNFRFPGHEKVRMVSSPLGKVPERWEVMPVSAAVELNPRTVVRKEGEKPFVPMNALSNDSMLINGVESREGNSGAKFKNGDTLFARITPCLENGKTGYVQFLADDDAVAFGSTEFVVMREGRLTREMIYLLARYDAFRNHAIKSMSGASGRQRVQERCFDTFLVAIPPMGLAGRFTEISRPLFRQAHTLSMASERLRAARDLVLPRLLSGELPVEAAG